MRKGGDWRSLSDPGKVAPVLVPAHPRHPPRAPPVGGQEEDGNVGRVPDDDGVELGRDCARKYMYVQSFPSHYAERFFGKVLGSSPSLWATTAASYCPTSLHDGMGNSVV